MLLGRACRAAGDEETAVLEFEAARAAFDRVGAVPDRDRADELLGRVTNAHGLTARELEVLRLVASGETNRAIASELVLSERTVDRHVSNIFVKLRVSSRAGATARAYEDHLL
jgi:DNA-binding NarL/FixJ family response regulator